MSDPAWLTRQVVSACVRCGWVLEASAHPTDDEAVPQVGDITVCLNCGQVHVFKTPWSIRPASRVEIEALEPDAAATVRKLQAFIAQRGAIKVSASSTRSIPLGTDEQQAARLQHLLDHHGWHFVDCPSCGGADGGCPRCAGHGAFLAGGSKVPCGPACRLHELAGN